MSFCVLSLVHHQADARRAEGNSQSRIPISTRQMSATSDSGNSTQFWIAEKVVSKVSRVEGSYSQVMNAMKEFMLTSL